MRKSQNTPTGLYLDTIFSLTLESYLAYLKKKIIRIGYKHFSKVTNHKDHIGESVIGINRASEISQIPVL